ncbi:Uncharacterised protein [Klebsiella oxytoca]|nr:Uncharacterised protein [Klebsiella oxytoca]
MAWGRPERCIIKVPVLSCPGPVRFIASMMNDTYEL